MSAQASSALITRPGAPDCRTAVNFGGPPTPPMLGQPSLTAVKQSHFS
jgi:hypothetical protein